MSLSLDLSSWTKLCVSFLIFQYVINRLMKFVFWYNNFLMHKYMIFRIIEYPNYLKPITEDSELRRPDKRIIWAMKLWSLAAPWSRSIAVFCCLYLKKFLWLITSLTLPVQRSVIHGILFPFFKTHQTFFHPPFCSRPQAACTLNANSQTPNR